MAGKLVKYPPCLENFDFKFALFKDNIKYLKGANNNFAAG